MTRFSFAINIERKKNSLFAEKHMRCDMVHVWVRLYVHSYIHIISSYDGLISIFSSYHTSTKEEKNPRQTTLCAYSHLILSFI